MNEAETRAERIDPALKAAGWGVVEGTRILREYHITPGRIEGLGRHAKPLSARPWPASLPKAKGSSSSSDPSVFAPTTPAWVPSFAPCFLRC